MSFLIFDFFIFIFKFLFSNLTTEKGFFGAKSHWQITERPSPKSSPGFCRTANDLLQTYFFTRSTTLNLWLASQEWFLVIRGFINSQFTTWSTISSQCWFHRNHMNNLYGDKSRRNFCPRLNPQDENLFQMKLQWKMIVEDLKIGRCEFGSSVVHGSVS